VQGGECQLYDVTTTISREILAQSFLPFVVIPRSEIALQIQIVYSTTELLISPIVAEIYRSSSTEPKEPSAVSWISELLTNLLVPARRWVPTDKTGQGLQLMPTRKLLSSLMNAYQLNALTRLPVRAAPPIQPVRGLCTAAAGTKQARGWLGVMPQGRTTHDTPRRESRD